MKKIVTFITIAAAALCLVSCDKIFDSLEGDLTKMSAEDLMSTEAGLDRLLANLYSYIPMGAYSGVEKNTPNANDSATSGNYAQNLSGFWNYTVVRDVNSFIIALDSAKEKGIISEAQYNVYLGEAHFIRAYYYFGSVRAYGGVPIVTEPLDDKFDGDENLGLYIPRNTEKETWDFVLSELDLAIGLLPESRNGGLYRATKWSALGLKSRVALWAASECKHWKDASIPSNYKAVSEKLAFMDAGDANGYYQQCIQACEALINSGKFSLYKPTPASVDEAIKNYSDLFLSRQNEEFIFGKSYKDGTSNNTNDYFDLRNSPYQVRDNITQVWRFGCYGVTLDMVDVYDNYTSTFGAADGTIVTRTDGKENEYVTTIAENAGKTAIKGISFVKYDNPADAFANKDARFKASVIYPGINFRGKVINIQGGIWKSDGTINIYEEANPSEELNGKTYYQFGGATPNDFSGFRWLGNTNDGSWYSTGFGIRKFLNYNKVDTYSQTLWYDIRYTEILLNYCEAQVEMSGTNAGKSKEYLNAIRRRAYFQDQKDATIENVMHERRVELAFEDDYPATLQRRREFFNQQRDLASNPAGGRKHALVPMVVLQNGEAKYIFVRANAYDYDIDKKPGISSFDSKYYYSAIPNYEKNKITVNPVQE